MRCPNCLGSDIDKERYLGADTGDMKCADCGYVGSRGSFLTVTGRLIKNIPGPRMQNIPIPKKPS